MQSDDLRTVIRVRGAADNNLARLDIDLPHGRWVAVTGPSGSGKTSLVFDTLVREGERRFLGGLSARARHFFGKLGRSDVESITGLPATIAVGQHATSPSSRSTVGTLTGALDLLRLVFARCATIPGEPTGTRLTRSDFSFNHPVGQCPACHGLGLEDRVDPAKIIADVDLSLRAGALVPTLKSGYTVYSQVTLEVMDRICHAHGFDVDTPWKHLSEDQRNVILYGTRALKVPFGKHPIESRMKWEGITARPREEGYYLGLVPVIEETLKRNRNPNILRFVSSGPCSACGGTRLARAGRTARFGDVTLPDILDQPASRLLESLNELPDAAAWNRVRPALTERIERLARLGLGHLSLARSSTSLSGGEAQRVRLAAQLGRGLSGVLYALDEPTLGLHPESQDGMRKVLDELIVMGNSLLVVEHDPDMVRAADHVLHLGPGAGSEGGQIVATDLPGHPQTVDREADPLGGPAALRTHRRAARGHLLLTGATLHNLASAKLDLHLATFNVVMGPSGAGKSSLIFGTLLPALLGTEGGPFESLSYDDVPADPGTARGKPSIQAVDARPIGNTPRSTPATWCGLFDLVRKRFAKLEAASALGLTASHFSFNNAHERCPNCEGLGVTRIGLHLFEDVELVCDACAGKRYGERILGVELDGKNVAQVLALTFREAHTYFADDPEPARLCAAMVELGLGYLTLGQSSGSLSRGEAQRVKLGTLLGSQRAERGMVLLDEPDRGLAPIDVEALLRSLDALVDAGHTVVAISHQRHVWAAADHLIEVRCGQTNHSPVIDNARLGERRAARSLSGTSALPIELQDVRTHNLRGIDVAFPHGKLSAVCGVSGSGKSSLVFDTLAAEAQARFAESLPFQVRRFMRRLPQPKIGSARGLTPTLSLRQGQERRSTRSTVATQSECGPLLRLLYSRAGMLDGAPCGLSAAHFSRERAVGACAHCSGSGTLQRCDPQRLITHPDAPLIPGSPKAVGALTGTRPGRFFTEADGQHMATLATALAHENSTEEELLAMLSTTPWCELSPTVQSVALQGTGATRHAVKWQFASRVEGTGQHDFEACWEGLCALVEAEARSRARSKKAAEWAAPLGDSTCPECSGAGLTQEARNTTVRGFSLPAIERLPLGELLASLQADGSVEGALHVQQETALGALLPELAERLDALVGLGLGHLSLARRTTTLSSGEFQRVRLAGVLRSGLSNVTLALDEPTAGLHERDVLALLRRLREFQAAGNTVVVVSHRQMMIEAAEHVLQLGPGAGAEGGQLMEGMPQQVEVSCDTTRPLDPARIQIRGARAHNLARIDVELPLSGLVCITGVSGSGKSSLAYDVIAASLEQRSAVECESLDVPGGPGHFVAVHGQRSGRATGTSRSTLTVLDIAGDVAALFHEADLPRRAFVPGGAPGRCPECAGSGRERVAMDFLGDLDLPCQACAGTRFRSEVLAARWRGKSIADLLDQPAAALLDELDRVPAAEHTKSHRKLVAALETLADVAAAHIPLGRPRSELSGGESARVALAASLLHSESPALYVFDEPSTGLHESDLVRVTAAFRRLGERGDLVVATEHRLSAIAAADWIIDLGPEGGPDGGRLVDSGPPDRLTRGHTAAALKASPRA
ncbi:MAG: excinuclease ABC subunit A [Chlamydiales bacterium]|jgi:excinuclease ABC subunit A